MNLHQANSLIGGTLIGKTLQFRGVSIDSRKDCTNKIFIALQGDNFNGEQFCQQAVDNGAIAILVTHAIDLDIPQLVCEDTLNALSILAKNWTKQCQAKIIAITGSNGKTTVKNMINSILSQSNQCSATRGNLNNEIGVPLTLCQIHPDDKFSVVEMGAAKTGDISWLISLVEIHTAVITNVSAAHIGRFGSFENIVKEKSQILSKLDDSAYAVLPIDDANFSNWKNSINCNVLSFGENDKANVITNSLASIQLPVAGKHNLSNAACAKAIALSCDIAEQDIINGLKNFKPEMGRLENLGIINGVQIINDAYNANPSSVKAAIDVLAQSKGPTTLVLGDMAELGDDSKSLHQQMGEYAQKNNITQLISIGKQSAHASEKFSGGQHFDKMDKLKTHLLTNWNTIGTLLVKGSRSMHLENLINALIDSEKAA
jgi:UDP-N-acetylmuramoyl-tripeptide--D-alanyl-D-alanine ligase